MALAWRQLTAAASLLLLCGGRGVGGAPLPGRGISRANYRRAASSAHRPAGGAGTGRRRTSEQSGASYSPSPPSSSPPQRSVKASLSVSLSLSRPHGALLTILYPYAYARPWTRKRRLLLSIRVSPLRPLLFSAPCASPLSLCYTLLTPTALHHVRPFFYPLLLLFSPLFSLGVSVVCSFPLIASCFHTAVHPPAHTHSCTQLPFPRFPLHSLLRCKGVASPSSVCTLA